MSSICPICNLYIRPGTAHSCGGSREYRIMSTDHMLFSYMHNHRIIDMSYEDAIRAQSVLQTPEKLHEFVQWLKANSATVASVYRAAPASVDQDEFAIAMLAIELNNSKGPF